MKEQIQGLHEDLQKTPVTLEELKQVLNTINNIRSSSMVMELRYTDLEERFRYNLCCTALTCACILQAIHFYVQPAFSMNNTGCGSPLSQTAVQDSSSLQP